MLESVGVADCDHELTRAKAARVAELHGAEIRGRDSDHRDVGVRILTDQIGGALAAIRQGDRDVVGVLDDVAVGEDQAVGSEHESRPGASLRA
jgi:hypothetical protein